ncbi:MAG: hypothetical protein ACJAZO_004176 [Myxococcota bacterium]|jgi:uncharacterized protein YdiU (UPF0061 family)
MAYAAHQFGHFVPQLGDGRAILLGELSDQSGTLQDVQLKGSGPTPFSRRGDGRNWFGPVLREYVLSEWMHTMGIPTTRALAAVATGEYIQRQRVLPGAILTRVARSHIRVGTFEYYASRQDMDGLNALVDHLIAHHYPDAANADWPALALLQAIGQRQAELVAHWLSVGFIHGVMNTDNCSATGDTLDYGPCAFMDDFREHQVFSAIDQRGRYAYSNQAPVAQWNLSILARALLPLIGADIQAGVALAQPVIDAFPQALETARLAHFRLKIGLVSIEDGDDALVNDLLTIMNDDEADFTRTFRGLSHNTTVARAEFAAPQAFDAWTERWTVRVARDQDESSRQTRMQSVNPAYIPRNHRIETVIEAAVQGNLGPLNTFADVLAKPFSERPEYEEYALGPKPNEVVHATFCGT